MMRVRVRRNGLTQLWWQCWQGRRGQQLSKLGRDGRRGELLYVMCT